MLIIVGLFAIKKDNELKLEREARITDAKNYTDLALNLQKQVLEAIDTLSEILDEMKKMNVTQPRRSSLGGE